MNTIFLCVRYICYVVNHLKWWKLLLSFGRLIKRITFFRRGLEENLIMCVFNWDQLMVLEFNLFFTCMGFLVVLSLKLILRKFDCLLRWSALIVVVFRDYFQYLNFIYMLQQLEHVLILWWSLSAILYIFFSGSRVAMDDHHPLLLLLLCFLWL